MNVAFGFAHDLGVVGGEDEAGAKVVAHLLHEIEDAIGGVVIEIGSGSSARTSLGSPTSARANGNALLLTTGNLVRPL